MEDLTLIDEQRLALEARISQVSEVVENIFTGSFFRKVSLKLLTRYLTVK